MGMPLLFSTSDEGAALLSGRFGLLRALSGVALLHFLDIRHHARVDVFDLFELGVDEIGVLHQKRTDQHFGVVQTIKKRGERAEKRFQLIHHEDVIMEILGVESARHRIAEALEGGVGDATKASDFSPYLVRRPMDVGVKWRRSGVTLAVKPARSLWADAKSAGESATILESSSRGMIFLGETKISGA